MKDLLVIYRVIGNVQRVIWRVPPLCDNVPKSRILEYDKSYRHANLIYSIICLILKYVNE